MAGLVCWHCGASLRDVPKPISRLSQCKACGADLHVCRLCKFYNPKLLSRCDNDQAEPAREIDIANFCGYFHPTANAFGEDHKRKSDQAIQRLKTLFGDNESDQRAHIDGAQQQDKPEDKQSKLDAARAKFESLFK